MKQKDSDKYSIEMVFAQSQIDRVSSIFMKNYNPKNKDHIAWQYLDCPGGGAYTAFAVSQFGQDAAVYSVFKVKAKLGNEIRTVCQSLDTLTDENHRGKGLFPIIASEVFNQCDKGEVDFIYGFPNSSSAPGFFGKLGWKRLGEPSFIVYVNNLLFPISYFFKIKFFLKNYIFLSYLVVSSFLRKRRGNFQILSCVDFNSGDYNVLWNKFSESLPVCIWRDSEYMIWRYCKKPERHYSYFSVKRNDVLLGVVVYYVGNKHNGKVGYIMDVIYDPAFPQVGKILVADAVIAMSALGADVVLAWSSPSFKSHGSYSCSLFIPMPRRAQPIKLFFGYRPNAGSKYAEILPSDFYISYADSDTV